MKKICIIEDDSGIATSLKLYLENSNYEVCLYESGDGAIEFIKKSNPHLLLLDINLPGKGGIEICQELRRFSDIPVIMLTARGGEHDRIDGFEKGADDYVTKPFSPRELLARIQSHLKRNEKKQYTSGDILRYQNIEIYKESTEVHVNGEIISFTKNEYDILLKLFENQGKLVSRDALMKEVIGYDNYVYDRTIDTHIKNIRKKISNKDIIQTVRGKGYKLI